jgi:hypothetical protein
MYTLEYAEMWLYEAIFLLLNNKDLSIENAIFFIMIEGRLMRKLRGNV